MTKVSREEATVFPDQLQAGLDLPHPVTPW